MHRICLDTYLSLNWIGQAKKNGVKAQVHVMEQGLFLYGRNGQILSTDLTLEVSRIVRQNFNVGDVFEAEYLRIKKALYPFEMVASKGEVLRGLTYAERFALLPKIKVDGIVETLPLLTTPEQIMESYSSKDTEGVVFKSLTTKGFSDSSIVRCRKRKLNNFSNGEANRLRDR